MRDAFGRVVDAPRDVVFDTVASVDVLDGIARDIDEPSANANGAVNAIKKKHNGNLLIFIE